MARLLGIGECEQLHPFIAAGVRDAYSLGAPRCASVLGKTSNCRTLVSLTLVRGDVPVMSALRLFRLGNGTSDRNRSDTRILRF